MSLRLIAPLALAAALAPVAGLAADRPVVVELFTSQGCSSCPPANAYLNELARDRSDVLALAFHVTYWDRLGWKDPFSMTQIRRRILHAGDRHRRRIEPCRLPPRRSRPGDRRRETAGPDRDKRQRRQSRRSAHDRCC
jgi:hypothetical protein